MDAKQRRAKKKILSTQIKSVRVSKGMRASDLVSAMADMSIQARNILLLSSHLIGTRDLMEILTEARRPGCLDRLVLVGDSYARRPSWGTDHGQPFQALVRCDRLSLDPFRPTSSVMFEGVAPEDEVANSIALALRLDDEDAPADVVFRYDEHEPTELSLLRRTLETLQNRFARLRKDDDDDDDVVPSIFPHAFPHDLQRVFLVDVKDSVCTRYMAILKKASRADPGSCGLHALATVRRDVDQFERMWFDAGSTSDDPSPAPWKRYELGDAIRMCAVDDQHLGNEGRFGFLRHIEGTHDADRRNPVPCRSFGVPVRRGLKLRLKIDPMQRVGDPADDRLLEIPYDIRSHRIAHAPCSLVRKRPSARRVPVSAFWIGDSTTWNDLYIAVRRTSSIFVLFGTRDSFEAAFRRRSSFSETLFSRAIESWR